MANIIVSLVTLLKGRKGSKAMEKRTAAKPLKSDNLCLCQQFGRIILCVLER